MRHYLSRLRQSGQVVSDSKWPRSLDYDLKGFVLNPVKRRKTAAIHAGLACANSRTAVDPASDSKCIFPNAANRS